MKSVALPTEPIVDAARFTHLGKHRFAVHLDTLVVEIKGNVSLTEIQVLFAHQDKINAKYGYANSFVRSAVGVSMSSDARRWIGEWHHGKKPIGICIIVDDNPVTRMVFMVLHRAVSVLLGSGTTGEIAFVASETTGWQSLRTWRLRKLGHAEPIGVS